MSALVGKIEEFNSAKEEWPQYVERIEHFFVANGITTGDKKRATFLSLIGPSTYKLVRSLVAPTKPGEKSYTDLVEALSNHFSPTPSETVQRFKFHSRRRKPEESIATYVSELRLLAQFCNFGTTLEQMLRDRLVCGVNNDRIQLKLLSEANLDYNKALELAHAIETAEKNHKEIGKGRESWTAGVNKISSSADKGKSEAACYRCGKPGHLAVRCRFKDVICHNCGKKGHLRKVCRSKPRKQLEKKGVKSQPVRHVTEEEEEQEFPLYHINTLHSEHTQPLEVSVIVENRSIVMEVDTGAALSLVPEASYKEFWPDKALESSSSKLCSYSGDSIPVLGSLDVSIQYKDQITNLPLLVVEGSGPSLFGRNWLKCIKLDWQEINYLQSNALQAILDRHQEVFKEGLGTLQGYKARIGLMKMLTQSFVRLEQCHMLCVP